MRKADVLALTPDALADYLHLPEGAKITAVDSPRPGVLNLRIEGWIAPTVGDIYRNLPPMSGPTWIHHAG